MTLITRRNKYADTLNANQCVDFSYNSSLSFDSVTSTNCTCTLDPPPVSLAAQLYLLLGPLHFATFFSCDLLGGLRHLVFVPEILSGCLKKRGMAMIFGECLCPSKIVSNCKIKKNVLSDSRYIRIFMHTHTLQRMTNVTAAVTLNLSRPCDRLPDAIRLLC